MSYVLCLHRWVGSQALYDEYDLEAGLEIRFICTPESVASLPVNRLASRSVLPSLDDCGSVMREVEKMIVQHGVPTKVVALNEGDLLNAALIRERWGVPGDNVDWAERFRDKLNMLDVAALQTSIAVLPARKVESEEALAQFGEEHGYPLVLKPRYGTASRGVKILHGPAEIHGVEFREAEPMMVQVYCPAPILHVDGWWDGQRLVVVTVSRYLNTCADFGPDSPLGSIELEAGVDERSITDRVAHLLTVFAPLSEIVFHLELFEMGSQLLFLEIAARVGGAEIPFVWRDVRGIDLVGIAWELQAGASNRYREAARRLSSSGRPQANDRGAWVIARRGVALPEGLETLYWEQPQSVERCASGVYEGARTRVRLRSSDHSALQRDVGVILERLSQP